MLSVLGYSLPAAIYVLYRFVGPTPVDAATGAYKAGPRPGGNPLINAAMTVETVLTLYTPVPKLHLPVLEQMVQKNLDRTTGTLLRHSDRLPEVKDKSMSASSGTES